MLFLRRKSAVLEAPVFLITPPFTQLNTPYPATAYLKGFLKTRSIEAFQADLGIEVTLALFTRSSLTELFEQINTSIEYSENSQRILRMKQRYLDTVDGVIRFLQGADPTM